MGLDSKAKVLVVIVYTDYKEYCKFLYPEIYEMLTYKRKELLFVTEKNCPELTQQPTGEQVAATGRNFGVKHARKGDYTHIFFLDFDTKPEPDAIQRLLSLGKPLAGGLHAARGNPWQVIGHNYRDRGSLERLPLLRNNLHGVVEVDGVTGGYLLVSRKVFEKVDYDDYLGPETIPGRHTADDEFFEIEAFNKLGVLPVVRCDLKSWHYSDDGFRYRNFGEVERWQK